MATSDSMYELSTAMLAALGGKVAEYPVLKSVWIAMLAGVTLTGLGANLASTAYLRIREDVTGMVIATILILTGAIFFWHGFSKRTLKVDVYENGMVHARAGKLTAFLWAGIASIRQESTMVIHSFVPMGTKYKVSVTGKNGERITLTNHLRDVAGLTKRIHEATYPHLMPSAVIAFRRGQTVDFGAVSMNKQGIIYKGKTLPWIELEEVKFAAGAALICKKGAFLTWGQPPMAKIDNFYVFAGLIEDVKKDAAILLNNV